MAKVQKKYENESGKKMVGYAVNVLIFALVTAAIFVGVSITAMLG